MVLLAAPGVLALALALAPAGASLPRDGAAVIARAQTRETRRCRTITLPPLEPVRAPYQVELFAVHLAATSASSIEIERTDRGATVTRLDVHGRRIVALDDDEARQLDRWAALAIQLSRARTREPVRDDLLCPAGFGHASHMPSRTVVIATNAGEQLRAGPLQPIFDSLTFGVPAVTASWTVNSLEGALSRWLAGAAPVEVSAGEASEQLRRLPHVGAGKRERAVVLGRLYADVLARRGDRSAIALLARKGYELEALQVELRTMADSDATGVLAPLLCAPEWVVRDEALRAAERLGAKAGAALLRAQDCAPDPWADEAVVRRIAALPRDPETRAAIDAATASTRPLRVQVAARGARLREREDAADRGFLEATARGDAADEAELARTELAARPRAPQ